MLKCLHPLVKLLARRGWTPVGVSEAPLLSRSNGLQNCSILFRTPCWRFLPHGSGNSAAALGCTLCCYCHSQWLYVCTHGACCRQCATREGGLGWKGGVGGETQRCEPGSDKQHKEAGAKKDLGFRIYNNNQILFGRFVVIKSFC